MYSIHQFIIKPVNYHSRRINNNKKKKVKYKFEEYGGSIKIQKTKYTVWKAIGNNTIIVQATAIGIFQ